MDTDRRIHHLRLTAADDASARAVQTRLADALRCASLPGAGGRLLLVRRLALGRLNPRASAQQIALRLEQGVAAAGWTFVDGASPAAAQASAVAFASATEARLRLSAALLRGERPAGWHWPLAVPEYRTDVPAAESLCRIARALAAAPDAPAAMPAWVALAAREGCLAALAAAVPAALGASLVAAAGGRLPNAPARDAHTNVSATSNADLADAAGPAVGDPTPPHWIAALLTMAGSRRSPATTPTPTPGTPPTRHARHAAEPARDLGVVDGGPRPVAAQPSGQRNAPPSAEPADAPAAPVRQDDAPRPPRPRWRLPADAQATAPASLNRLPNRPALGEPTRLGGLLFLLPVLDQLGLPGWTADRDAEHDLPLRILHAAARRLHGMADDPLLTALGVPADAAGAVPVVAPPAPAVWRHPLLRAPRGRPVDLPAALRSAADGDVQAEVWLAAARRWLRRAARIGLASLVCRPARVAAGPTHLDLRFALDAADLRVRRAGLDTDPGWHAGLQRVVAFHYGQGDTP